jgi:hypothetical protein
MNANTVDSMAARLIDAVIGSGPSNPLEGLIRAGMTGADALQLRDSLNAFYAAQSVVGDGEADYMAQIIAHFAASCARIAVQNTKG